MIRDKLAPFEATSFSVYITYVYDPDAGVHGAIYLAGDTDANASRLGRQTRENSMAVILLTNTRVFLRVRRNGPHEQSLFSLVSLHYIVSLYCDVWESNPSCGGQPLNAYPEDHSGGLNHAMTMTRKQ